jgi:sulfur relay (sulfurtransferase) complex TusBCD TusD component (DsrE family)
MKREYFYKDGAGENRKYVYCSCGAGPFRRDQEYNPLDKTGDFLELGAHVLLCRSCAKLRGIIDPPPPLPQSFIMRKTVYAKKREKRL